MKRFFYGMLAIALPWVIIMMDDNPGGAILALILQGTLIGWIPAAMWAWRVSHQPSWHTNTKKKES